MLRSIEFPVDPRWIKNPKNSSPNASKGARQGAAAITRLCIVTIGLVLDAHFKVPTAWLKAPDGQMQANRWTVTLTRMSMGVVDPITGGATMAAVQDAVALWCGVKDERDPVWQWVEPIRQEKRGRGFFGVRIVIDDLAPGEQPPVTLKTIEPFIWKAKQRIKEAKMYKDGIKRTGRVLTYQPEAGARAASSAARGRAEQSFAKLTGKTTGPAIERLTEGQRDAMAAVIEHHYGKPTALDLRDAAERSLSKAARRVREAQRDTTREITAIMVSRDPGEERPARDLAACTTCGRGTGQPCDEKVPGPMVLGVHMSRARSAGYVAAGKLADVYKAPTNGSRRIVTPPVTPAYVRLPWEAKPCGACGGHGSAHGHVVLRDGAYVCATCLGKKERKSTRRDPRHDGEDAPTRVVFTVPAEHRARFGDRVTLTRRRTTLPKLGDVWLYE